MIITFKGTKSGKEYSTPVSYVKEDDAVYCFTHGRWWRNLATGADVRVRVKGQDYQGHAVAEAEDVPQISAALRKLLLANPIDGRFYGVTFESEGEPNAEELNKAAAEAVMIRISIESQIDPKPTPQSTV